MMLKQDDASARMAEPARDALAHDSAGQYPFGML
jgi:hypothetical protein